MGTGRHAIGPASWSDDHPHSPRHLRQESALQERGGRLGRGATCRRDAAPVSLRTVPRLSPHQPDQGHARAEAGALSAPPAPSPKQGLPFPGRPSKKVDIIIGRERCGSRTRLCSSSAAIAASAALRRKDSGRKAPMCSSPGGTRRPSTRPSPPSPARAASAPTSPISRADRTCSLPSARRMAASTCCSSMPASAPSPPPQR